MAAIARVIMLAVMVAACGSDAIRSSASVATDPPASTLSPSAEPTPSEQLLYRGFLEHSLETSETLPDEYTALVDGFTAGIDNDDAGILLKTVTEFGEWVAQESRWFEEHPPAECYAEAHDAMAHVFDAFQEATDALRRWAQAYPLGSAADAQQALNYIDLTLLEMADATAAVTAASC